MTPPDADRAEFDRLLARLCEADSSADNLARLEQLFIQDPGIQAHYYCYMQLRAIADAAPGRSRPSLWLRSTRRPPGDRT